MPIRLVLTIVVLVQEVVEARPPLPTHPFLGQTRLQTDHEVVAGDVQFRKWSDVRLIGVELLDKARKPQQMTRVEVVAKIRHDPPVCPEKAGHLPQSKAHTEAAENLHGLAAIPVNRPPRAILVELSLHHEDTRFTPEGVTQTRSQVTRVHSYVSLGVRSTRSGPLVPSERC